LAIPTPSINRLYYPLDTNIVKEKSAVMPFEEFWMDKRTTDENGYLMFC
jgi:hypothetical protein